MLRCEKIGTGLTTFDGGSTANPEGEGAGFRASHENWAIVRWNKTEQTEWMGDFPTADDALAELHSRFDRGDSALVSRRKIAVNLEIHTRLKNPIICPIVETRGTLNDTNDNG